jgi:hypothetical protein
MLESGNKHRATMGQATRGSLASLQQGESAPTGTAIAELSLRTAAKLTPNKRCISWTTPSTGMNDTKERRHGRLWYKLEQDFAGETHLEIASSSSPCAWRDDNLHH